MHCSLSRSTTLSLLLSAFMFCIEPCVQAQSPVDFEQDVAPLLIRRCLECHQSTDPSGGLALDSADGLLKGGDSGKAIELKSAESSLLFQRVKSGEMPPVKHGDSQALPPEEIDVLRQWILDGATFPRDRRLDLYERTTDVRGGRDWWSFQPLKPVQPPQVAGLPKDANPIDLFIAQSLQQHGLTPAPAASPQILIRRLYWDVVGLPATAEEIDRFVQGSSDPAAVNRLIDDLLRSPQHGERWARHWLDVVRFAETCGYERDQVKPFAWKYRDLVVNAINNDMPYDQFIREQLAGDEIPQRSEQSVIATGFLCLGTWNDEPNDAEDYKYERLEDLVHTTSSAFLGMTTKCARCHDHKFDPIPQTDYYRMAAAFWPGPIQPRGRELIGGASAEELGYRDVLGWTDVTRTPSPLHKLKNGERLSPLEVVSAGTLSFAPALFREFTSQTQSSRTTGLRLQLANWIASPENPLTARVIVNRIWQHHFGEAIVRSSNNFGYTGDKPTHPELLDWLAGELIRTNWSLRHVHRLILTSRTWQQSSIHPRQSEYDQIDAANRFLWRAHRRRKDAESLRDAFLASTGELKLTVGGPSFYPTISEEALEGLSRKASAWNASPEADQHRRSLYAFTQRSLLPPLLTTFDLCDSTMSCGQRDVTIVAPQALTLLNNEFVHQRAEALAVSLTSDEIAGDEIADDLEQVASAERLRDSVEKVWLAILNRQPTESERQLSMDHVSLQQQRFDKAANPDLFEVPTDDPEEQSKLIATAVLYLDASRGVTVDENGLLQRWQNQNGKSHAATQPDSTHRPRLIPNAISGHAAVRFDGVSSFLNVDGSLLKTDDVTVLAVVTDNATSGHRELLSNWSGRDGNSGTSFFLGMTNDNAVRLSDALSGVGQIADRNSPFLLTGSNGPRGASVQQQTRVVVEQSQPLPQRRLDTPWVIGQQGNIDGEYWNGDVACLIVFDRQLTPDELRALQTHLISRFQLPTSHDTGQVECTPEQRALASLGLVLFNSNEFAYVD